MYHTGAKRMMFTQWDDGDQDQLPARVLAIGDLPSNSASDRYPRPYYLGVVREQYRTPRTNYHRFCLCTHQVTSTEK